MCEEIHSEIRVFEVRIPNLNFQNFQNSLSFVCAKDISPHNIKFFAVDTFDSNDLSDRTHRRGAECRVLRTACSSRRVVR